MLTTFTYSLAHKTTLRVSATGIQPAPISEGKMKKLLLAALLALVASGAQAQDATEKGPIEIKRCQTISASGSYKLVDNLTIKAAATCLPITANGVTIDLAGFSISGPTASASSAGVIATAIAAGDKSSGITVRNGSITGFFDGVNLAGQGSIVEGLRVFTGFAVGIVANGIVKGNTVLDFSGGPGNGIGIEATGIITGNFVSGSRIAGIEAGQGSTVIGNTATGNFGALGAGIVVACPSNVSDNTAVNNGPAGPNLLLNGQGCNNTNNVAP
jgi:hypothetical protein